MNEHSDAFDSTECRLLLRVRALLRRANIERERKIEIESLGPDADGMSTEKAQITIFEFDPHFNLWKKKAPKNFENRVSNALSLMTKKARNLNRYGSYSRH